MLTREQASALVFAFRALTDTRDAAVIRDDRTGHHGGYAVVVHERAPRGSALVAGMRLAEFTTLADARAYFRDTLMDEVMQHVQP